MKRNFVFVLFLFLHVFKVDSSNFNFCNLPEPLKTEVKKLTLGDVSTSQAKFTYTICGKAVTEIGLCYSSSQNPTPSSAETIIEYQGEAVDIPINVDYKARIKGLEQGKEYFARAYIKNESGELFYSDELNFKTQKDKIDYDAMLNGPKKEFYPNGVVMREYNLKDGHVEGNYRFYDDSARIVSDQYIKNDLPNGITKTYFKNGQIESITNYKDGLQDGMAKSYFKSGSIKSESLINGMPPNISGTMTHYYENGQKQSYTVISSGLLSSFIHFDDQGRITEEGSPGNVTSYHYDKDGWKHTSINGEKCTCARCSSNNSNY